MADDQRTRIQFSLSTLLLLPVFVAGAYAVLFATPPAVVLPELLIVSFILPALLATVVIYGKSYARTFCIGALFPAGALWLYCAMWIMTMVPVPESMNSSDVARGLRWSVVEALSAAVLSGLLCMALRWSTAGGRQWRRLALVVVLALLLFSGPILGKIGVHRGWWAAEPVTVPAPPAYGTTSAPSSYANP